MTNNQNTGQKIIAVNEMLYFILVHMDMLHIIYAQHNIWWDNKIVGYNNYTHTVIRLTPSYMIFIILALEHSKFDEHVPLKKINDLFNYKQCALFHHVIMCHILYSLRNTKYEIVYFKNMIKNKWQKNDNNQNKVNMFMLIRRLQNSNN